MTTEDYRAQRLGALAGSAGPELPGDPLTAGTDREEAHPSDPVTFTDKSRPKDGRVAAMASAKLRALEQPDLVNGLVAVLADADDEPEVRRAALGALEEMSFSTSSFAPYDADFRRALRVAADASARPLADRALQDLALRNDEHVEQIVTARLQDSTATPEDRIQAMHLLASNLHARPFSVLRGIATQAGEPHERAAALRLLAADSGSRDLLQSSVDDRSEDTHVRIASATALNTLDPDAFSPTARGIVLNPEEDDDLRALALTALSVAPQSADQDDAQLLDAAHETNAAESSPELLHAIEQYRHARTNRARN